MKHWTRWLVCQGRWTNHFGNIVYTMVTGHWSGTDFLGWRCDTVWHKRLTPTTVASSMRLAVTVRYNRRWNTSTLNNTWDEIQFDLRAAARTRQHLLKIMFTFFTSAPSHTFTRELDDFLLPNKATQMTWEDHRDERPVHVILSDERLDLTKQQKNKNKSTRWSSSHLSKIKSEATPHHKGKHESKTKLESVNTVTRSALGCCCCCCFRSYPCVLLITFLPLRYIMAQFSYNSLVRAWLCLCLRDHITLDWQTVWNRQFFIIF